MSHELKARLALEKQGFRFTHSLGQNFLLNGQVVDRIAQEAQVKPGDNILEIGPGAGVLTAALLDRWLLLLKERGEDAAFAAIRQELRDSAF